MDNSEQAYHGDELALIGMSGRFPQANSTEAFWRNLCDGMEAISFFDEQTLLSSGVELAMLRDPQYVKARGLLADIELFDANFFDLTPREAEILDPQHRIFLECAWEALEQAGYVAAPDDLQIGVFASASMSSYLLNLYLNPTRSTDDFQIGLANDKDFLSTRIAYKLNLTGPAISVQTACSSSLVALHLACQSVLNGECDLAVAGGVSIHVPQREGYRYLPGDVRSPDGRCRTFDARAQGTVSGSGAAAVVLKRLEDALADGDYIHALIKGSAINNDGSAKIGYTAPSVRGQAQVIAGALTMARVSPETITYVEAHGTGTALGDPIEVAALTEAFRTGTKRNGFCALGSVKTNIGHLDAAAGIAGLIKTVLSLKHGMIPPSLHFEQPNPQIDFANSPFYVNTKLMPWTRGSSPRRAGVSSFGIGGTNAHVVLEEAPPEQPATSARPWQLLLLSAKTDTPLEAQMDHLTAALRVHDAQRFADIAYTLQVGRRGFSHRRALVCRDRDDALRTLASRDPRRILDSVVESTSRPVAFLLPGVGDQYVQMAADLYRSEPIFQSHLDRCCTILEPILGRDLRDVLYPGGPGDESAQTASSTATTLDLRAMLSGHDSSTDEAARMLNQTALSQPAVFAVEYALAQLWSTWGVRPQALLGYSLGEYVAACLAGVLTLEDALTLVARRAQLIQTLPESAMLAVPLAEHDAALLLNEQIFLAAINGPAMCVLAGPVPAITALERQLRERNVAARRLQARHAFHSPLMRPIALAFAEQLRQVTLRPPTLPYLSNITGTWISPDEATDPEYWVRHLCETVRFADDLQTLLVDPEQVLLEVGPGQSLTSLALQYPLADPNQARTVVASLRHSYERRSDRAVLLNSAAQLWLAGVALDWPALYRHEERRRVPLPTYPFERQRYWIEPFRHDRSDAVAALHGLRRSADLADWFYLPSWQLSVRPVPSTPIAQPPVIGRWLVFMDECGVGRQIVEQLERTGQAVTLVEVGAQFSHQTEHRFVLDPHKRTDYHLLVAALHESGHLPQRIVHLWNISADDSGSSSPERFAALQPLGFYSLLYLAQALASAQSDPLDIWVVAHGLHCLGSGDRCVPEKATLLGPCKTIPQEYPQITCRSIDIVIPAPGTWQAQQLTRQLMAELWSAADDRMIALRGGARWIPTFAPMRLGSASEPPPRLRQRGVYLITSELARESIAPARYLARTVQARLALVERTQLPPRDSWSSWLATHDDDVSAGIRGVQELEALGAEVLAISADVADETQMQTALRQVDQHFGALHGVIHAAGITAVEEACSIGELGPEECDRHFRLKVYGLYTLSRLLRGCQLDFCLLTSSIVAIIGGLGQCAYSAASIFMDAFAQRHNQDSPVAWTSLNWEGATLEETEDAFARLLAIEPTAQVIVSSEDLNARVARWSKLDFLRPSRQPARGSSPRPRLRNAYVAPTNPIEQRVVAIFQDILGIDEIGIHDSFFELGGDSLLGMQVLAHARQAFQIELPMRALFELPTAAALSDAVAQGQAQLADSAELARMLEELEQLSETELDALLVENRQNGEGDATDE